MNKIYKVIWSKAKNCYVVASELAKSHTKAPKSGVMSRALVAGVLACVLSCGAVLPVMAAGDASKISANSTSTVTGADVYAYLQKANLALGGGTVNQTSTSLPNIVIGNNAVDKFNYSGDGAKTAYTSVIIGNSAVSGSYGAVAIGSSAKAYDGFGISLGYQAQSGYDDSPSGGANIAIGYNALAHGASGNNIALGSSSKSLSSKNSIAIGTDAKTEGRDGSIAIGNKAYVRHYLSSGGGFNGGGIAIGTDARVTGFTSTDYAFPGIAIGESATTYSSKGLQYQMALGTRAYADDTYRSVALGYSSTAFDDDVVSIGHKKGDPYTYANSDSAHTQVTGTYGANLFRRIVNVADGKDDHDVATVGQIKNLGKTYSAGNGLSLNDDTFSVKTDGNVVSGDTGIVTGGKVYDAITRTIQYDEGTSDTVTLVGSSGTKLTNLKAATLSNTSTDAVTGAQLYAVKQDITGFAGDINRNKASIRDMNASISTALESVSSTSTLVDTIDNLKADTSLNNLTAAGQQVITNAAVNAVQEYMASQAEPTLGVTKPKLMGSSRLMTVNPAPADTNYVVYDDTTAGTLTLEGAVGTGTKITNVAEAELSAASMDAVNGSQLYAVTQQFDEFQSALSKNNTSIARAQTDINTIKTTNLNLQSQVNTLNTQMEAGMNVTIDGAMVKNVNPESNYVNFVTGDNIALSNDNGSLKISAKSDGVVTNGNTGLVSGGTVYNAIQDALIGYGGEAGMALAGKANADASNIGKNADTDNSSAWGQALGSGTVVQNDDRLVTGNTVYNETRVASDSNYIKKDVSAAANLQNLDTAVKTNADAIAAHSDMLSAHDDAIQQLQDGAVSTASDIEGLKDLSNLTDAGKSVIRNLAQNSTDIRSSDGSITTTVTADNGKIVYDLSVNTNGKVEEGNTGILTGDTVYHAIKDINPYGDNVITGTDSGAIGKRNTVAGNGSYSVGNDNTIAEGSDDIFVLGSNVNVTGHNSVVLGKDSDGSQDNVVSVGSDGHERKIVHVADGSLAKNSKDAVNGGQLYDVREDLRHANGVDVEDWSTKLGVGTVAEGDIGLVNGGTVYNALQHFTGSDAVTVDREYGALRVGASPKYDELPFVDFSNSQGAPRVLTGIATNIKDPSSAANVGYVNAVGEMVMQSVNGSLEHTNRRIEKVGAGAAAMSALTPASFEGDEKWSLAASVGNYRSATAGAVGAFYKPVENVMMNVRGSFGNDENMVAAGVAVSLNKGDVPGVTKRQLAKTVSAQAQEIQSLKDSHQVTLVQMQEMRQSYQSRFDEMSQQMNEMAETIKQLKAKTNG